MVATSRIRFLPIGRRRLAYEVRGDGPPLLVPAWWVSHVELDWHDDRFRRFWEGLADGYTLIRYDRFGVGLSDRDLSAADLTLEAEVDTLRALVDELRLDRVTLMGGSSGGCTALAFAAAHPETVERLVLYGAYADGGSITTPDVADAILSAVRAHWGLGLRVLSTMFLGDADPADHARCARFQRDATTAENAAALLDLVYRLDVRALLPRIRTPTLVVHRRNDRAVPYRLGSQLAAAIPGATFVPLHGGAHLPWYGDGESVVRACRQALGPVAPPARTTEPGRDLLSTREREILTSVARGLSDREIAEQLVLSPHTVHRHVANIRRKLGRTSRTAAVAEAARLGML